MATVAAARSPLSLYRAESEGMNTIPDPRSPSPASVYSREGSSPGSVEHHPDLSSEVATLSTKLINAINHSTSLDDALQETRHELEAARERIAQLEKAAKEHEELISQGLLIKRQDAQSKEDKLQQECTDERLRRQIAEKERKRMESELETLTASLFEEANAMVASARKDAESSKHRISQLQTQLSDTESLLASHQEQLQDLKAVMHQMSDRDENESNAHMSSPPSTPGLHSSGKMGRVLDAANLTPVTPAFGEDLQPQPPLFYHQLLTPVLRNDLPGFDDFRTLLRTSKTAHSSPASSRVASGNFNALNSMSLGLGASGAPQTPPLTPQSGQTGSPRESVNLQAPTLPPLKEAKYFKRVLPEDVEPTLRLDLAPGLSWLARRSVLQAITGQTLTIEPLVSQASRNYGPIFACALCGENGKADKYARKHQFRIQEDGPERAQRWPLCDWCLGRVRATCDFVSFLRMCQAGVWRADNSPDREKDAWEEGVRLREKMWWSRVGGGVVPSFALSKPSQEEQARRSNESGRASKEDDPFKAKDESAKRVSIGKNVIERPASTLDSVVTGPEAKRRDSGPGETSPAGKEGINNSGSALPKEEPQPAEAPQPNASDETDERLQAGSADGDKKSNRLSITIPGSLDQQ